jgi:hypothetical protein
VAGAGGGASGFSGNSSVFVGTEEQGDGSVGFWAWVCYMSAATCKCMDIVGLKMLYFLPLRVLIDS